MALGAFAALRAVLIYGEASRLASQPVDRPRLADRGATADDASNASPGLPAPTRRPTAAGQDRRLSAPGAQLRRLVSARLRADATTEAVEQRADVLEHSSPNPFVRAAA